MVTLGQVDPDFAAMLDALSGFTVSADNVADLQVATRAGPALSTDRVERTDHVVDPDRGVVVRLHVPRGVEGPRPCVLSIHGGGYVMGSRDLDDAHLGRRAAELGWIGASVEYRLAPSTPYPGPLDDCFAAYTWVHERADALGIDPALTGVAGTSAGGGLAAALTLLARERSVALPAFQLLEAPMIDDRCRTASSRLAGLPIWDRASNEFGWRSYLGDLHGRPDVPQFAAAARAVDLEGLPPTFVNVGTIDGFRDEAIEFATRLNQSGVPTELHVYAGAPHGFQLFADAAVSRRAAREVDAWLQRLAGEESAC